MRRVLGALGLYDVGSVRHGRNEHNGHDRRGCGVYRVCGVRFRSADDGKQGGMEKMKRIYLSHPYGGNEENRAKAACLAKFYRDIWAAEGKTDWVLVNPLEELSNMRGVDDETALFAAVALMNSCDTVLFADGWKKSRGCRYEHYIAHAKGKEMAEIPAEAEKIAVHWYGRHRIVVARAA